MPQVGRRAWQKFLHVGTLLVPRCQPVDSKTVPHIMKAGLIAGAVNPFNTGVFAQTGEYLFHDLDRNRSASAQDEERRVSTLRVTRVLSSRGVLRHRLG